MKKMELDNDEGTGILADLISYSSKQDAPLPMDDITAMVGELFGAGVDTVNRDMCD